jgi:hypothetical protein
MANQEALYMMSNTQVSRRNWEGQSFTRRSRRADGSFFAGKDVRREHVYEFTYRLRDKPEIASIDKEISDLGEDVHELKSKILFVQLKNYNTRLRTAANRMDTSIEPAVLAFTKAGTPRKGRNTGKAGIHCFKSKGEESNCLCRHNTFNVREFMIDFPNKKKDKYWVKSPTLYPQFPVYASKFDWTEGPPLFEDEEDEDLLRKFTAFEVTFRPDVYSRICEELDLKYNKRFEERIAAGEIMSPKKKQKTVVEDLEEAPKPTAMGNTVALALPGVELGTGEVARLDKTVLASPIPAVAIGVGGEKESRTSDPPADAFKNLKGATEEASEQNTRTDIPPEKLALKHELVVEKAKLLELWGSDDRHHVMNDENMYRKTRRILWDVIELRKNFVVGVPPSESLRAFLNYCFFDVSSSTYQFGFFNDPFGHVFCQHTFQIMVPGFEKFQDSYFVKPVTKTNPVPQVPNSEFPIDGNFKFQYAAMIMLRGYGRYVNSIGTTSAIESRKQWKQPNLKEFAPFLHKHDLTYYGREDNTTMKEHSSIASALWNPLFKGVREFLELHDASLKKKQEIYGDEKPRKLPWKYNEDAVFYIADADRNYQDHEENKSTDKDVLGFLFFIKGTKTLPFDTVEHPCNVLVGINKTPEFESGVKYTLSSWFGDDWHHPRSGQCLSSANGCRGLKFGMSSMTAVNSLCDLVEKDVCNKFLVETAFPLLDRLLPSNKSYDITIHSSNLISDNIGYGKVVQTGHTDYTLKVLKECEQNKTIPIAAMMGLESEGFMIELYPKGYDNSLHLDDRRNQAKLIMVPHESIILFPLTMFHGGGIRSSPRGNKRIQIVFVCTEKGCTPPEFPQNGENHYFVNDLKKKAINDAKRDHELDPAKPLYPEDLLYCHLINTRRPLVDDSTVASEDSQHVSPAMKKLAELFYLF